MSILFVFHSCQKHNKVERKSNLISIIPKTIKRNTSNIEYSIVKGKIVSADRDFQPFAFSGLMYTVSYPNGDVISESTSVDSFGYFSTKIQKQSRVEFIPYYDDYYRTDTTVFLGADSIINLKFTIKPKKYLYTEKKAYENIKRHKIVVVTFDSILFRHNKKIKYTEKFGFDYIYIPKPLDYEFIEKIEQYNFAINQYLDSINKDGYSIAISIIEDSLSNLKADNYGKNYKYSINEYKVPAFEKLPKQMQVTIKKQKEELSRIFIRYPDEIISYMPDFIISKIDKDKNYEYIFRAEYWLAYNYEIMIPELIKRITDNRLIGLDNTADLIIFERIESGDLQFYGHGGVAYDDLFKISGRANHLLKQITGENFGDVSMYSTQYRLQQIQKRWIYWLMNLNR